MICTIYDLFTLIWHTFSPSVILLESILNPGMRPHSVHLCIKKRNLIAKISLNREATTRFELVIAVLQTDALPLGYVAIKYRTITL